MQFLRELCCWHAYEYEQDDKGKMIKVCRKCGKNLDKI
jgi:hypothetical protein